jgi:cell volume regulation protein A
MDQVSLFLLTIAGVFLIGVLGEMVFERTQIPDAVWLVGVGVLLGPVSGLLAHDVLRHIAPFFAALTLIVILFDGGRRLSGSALGRSALPAIGLALATFVLSSVTVALVAQAAAAAGWLPGPWTLEHSILLGATLGGSSSVVVMPSMLLARVESRTAAVVSLESAITDVLCVVGAGTMTQLLLHASGSAPPLAVVARTFAIGLGAGAAAGAMWMLMLRLIRGSRHAFPLTLSGLLILYVVVDRTGGSAALAVLTFAVLVGNAASILKIARLPVEPMIEAESHDFYSQLVFIVKSFFFTFIGAMLGPPWGLATLGVVIGLGLLPLRLPGAWLAAWSMKLTREERGVVTVAVPRGLAAGVLATLPAAAGVPGTEALPVVVFPAVVTSILVFAFGFRAVRARRPTEHDVGREPPETTGADPAERRDSGPPGAAS